MTVRYRAAPLSSGWQAPWIVARFEVGVVGENSDSERVAWSNGDRAQRYREHANRLQQLAATETQSLLRERLLELARQYLELADRVGGSGRDVRRPSAI